MNMVQYLKQERTRLFEEGNMVFEYYRELASEKQGEIHEGCMMLCEDGINMMHESNALTPLIRMLQSHEYSYYFLIDKKYEVRRKELGL